MGTTPPRPHTQHRSASGSSIGTPKGPTKSSIHLPLGMNLAGGWSCPLLKNDRDGTLLPVVIRNSERDSLTVRMCPHDHELPRLCRLATMGASIKNSFVIGFNTRLATILYTNKPSALSFPCVGCVFWIFLVVRFPRLVSFPRRSFSGDTA